MAGGSSRGVQGGVSIFERIAAGQRQRPIHGSETAVDSSRNVAPHLRDLATRLDHRLDLVRARRLPPRECDICRQLLASLDV